MQNEVKFQKVFTQQAKDALRLGVIEAGKLGHTSLEVEHILFGLLNISESSSTRFLHSLGIDVQHLLHDVFTHFQPSDSRLADNTFPLSLRSKMLIENAYHLATEDGEFRKIDVQHLLEAMLLERDGKAGISLINLGITRESMHNWNIDVIHSTRVERKPEALQKPDGDEARRRKYVLDILVFLFSFLLVVLLLLVATVQLGGGIFLALFALCHLIWTSSWLVVQPVAFWFPLRVAIYFLLSVGMVATLAIPFDFLSLYIVPRRHDISTEATVARWFLAWMKKRAVWVAYGLVYAETLTLFIAVSPNLWWLWSSLSYFLFCLAERFVAPIIIYPVWYKMELLSDGPIMQRFIMLTRRTHVSLDKLYVLRGRKQRANGGKNLIANAYLMGLGHTRCVVLTNTLVDTFPIEEIESTLAHEMGHFVHRDVWKKLMCKTGILLIVLLLLWQWLPTCTLLLTVTPETFAQPPLLWSWIIGWYSLVSNVYLLVVFAVLAYRRFQRWREVKADEYELCVMQNVPIFISAKRRLRQVNTTLPFQLSYWSPFATHPSTEERVRHAEVFAAKRISEKPQ